MSPFNCNFCSFESCTEGRLKIHKQQHLPKRVALYNRNMGTIIQTARRDDGVWENCPIPNCPPGNHNQRRVRCFKAYKKRIALRHGDQGWEVRCYKDPDDEPTVVAPTTVITTSEKNRKRAREEHDDVAESAGGRKKQKVDSDASGAAKETNAQNHEVSLGKAEKKARKKKKKAITGEINKPPAAPADQAVVVVSQVTPGPPQAMVVDRPPKIEPTTKKLKDEPTDIKSECMDPESRSILELKTALKLTKKRKREQTKKLKGTEQARDQLAVENGELKSQVEALKASKARMKPALIAVLDDCW